MVRGNFQAGRSIDLVNFLKEEVMRKTCSAIVVAVLMLVSVMAGTSPAAAVLKNIGSVKADAVKAPDAQATVATLAALRTFDRAGRVNYVYMGGRITSGDGGGGVFRWNSSNLSSQVTADTLSGIYVAPTSAPTGASGAWVRMDQDARFEWWGAVPDGVTDNTAAFHAAFASNFRAFGLLPGKTYLTGPLTVAKKVVLYRLGSGDPSTTDAIRPIIKLSDNASGDHFTVTAGSNAILYISDIVLRGNKANQVAARNGITCTASTVFEGSVWLFNTIVLEYSGDGLRLQKHRNNPWVLGGSQILENDGHGIYGTAITDARFWQYDIGDNGLSNIYIEGTPDRIAENIRIGTGDIYHGGLAGDADDGSNIYIGDYVRSVFIEYNDILKAERHGVYIAPTSLTDAIVQMSGGRFSFNGAAADNTYSDVYAGHAGVTMTATVHRGTETLVANRVKYLVEVAAGAAGAIGIYNPAYSNVSYGTAPSNDYTKTQWMGTKKTRFAKDVFMQFNQSLPSSSLLDSYGADGTTTMYQVLADGKQRYGDGVAAIDTNLSRLAPGVMAILNNPVASKVSVPANLTATGKRGHYAADSTYLYIYTGDDTTHTWIKLGKQSAASADTAGAPGGSYNQAEVQAILTELRDLKTKMRSAGLLAP